MEAHQSRATDLCGCNLSDIEQGGDSELTNTKTHDSTANTDDSLVVGVGDLCNTTEKNADGTDPEDNLAAPAIVNGASAQGTEKITDVDSGGGHRLKRRGQLEVSVLIAVVSVVVLELLHRKNSIVVCVAGTLLVIERR